MRSVGEQPLTGQWAADEHYVLLGIINMAKCTGKFTNLSQSIPLITEIYSLVLELAMNNDIHISLSAKTSSQVRAKVDAYMKNEQLQQLCGSINFPPCVSK